VARVSAIFYALALTVAQQESFNNNLHLALISFLALGRVARRAFIARAPTSAPFPSNDKKYQLTHVVVTGACVLAQGGRPSTTLLWAGLLLTSANVGGNSSLCVLCAVVGCGTGADAFPGMARVLSLQSYHDGFVGVDCFESCASITWTLL